MSKAYRRLMRYGKPVQNVTGNPEIYRPFMRRRNILLKWTLKKYGVGR
jgi:hypothetical protein